ncbi:hypothetical protein DFH27DRAFT_602907 [Peziza echinospora]|nr:hypothetical protein DFH27DRAFT_602907 [Peziza echinospora]
MSPRKHGPSIPSLQILKATSVPEFLYPLLRAYLLGYASVVSPRLLQILVARVTRAKRARREALGLDLSWDEKPEGEGSGGEGSESGRGERRRKRVSVEEEGDTIQKILTTLKKCAQIHRFPAFCGITVGGSRLLQPLAETALGRTTSLLGIDALGGQKGEEVVRLLATFVASMVSGGVGMTVLNSGPAREDGSGSGMVGRTLDLTLIAVARALDVVVGSAWEEWKGVRRRRGIGGGGRGGKNWDWLEGVVERNVDSVVFAGNAAAIMYAFFYLPEKLPRAYQKWIEGMSELDQRVIIALQQIKRGEFIYGKDTGKKELLGGYCRSLGLPEELGDPAVTVPIPCLLVHSNKVKNCELHALYRFYRAWKAAFVMYIPLNLAVTIRRPSVRNLLKATLNAARSSTFLGAFVALFYYGVCFTRNRFGPAVFPGWDRLVWDNQVVVRVGCFLSGLSIWIEQRRRRMEIGFFVAPRALAVGLPRRYKREYLWRESMAFAVSFAVIMTALKKDKARVRGVFGRLLGRIVQ